MNREISYTVYGSTSLFPHLCCEVTLGPETCLDINIFSVHILRGLSISCGGAQNPLPRGESNFRTISKYSAHITRLNLSLEINRRICSNALKSGNIVECGVRLYTHDQD